MNRTSKKSKVLVILVVLSLFLAIVVALNIDTIKFALNSLEAYQGAENNDFIDSLEATGNERVALSEPLENPLEIIAKEEDTKKEEERQGEVDQPINDQDISDREDSQEVDLQPSTGDTSTSYSSIVSKYNKKFI